MKKILFAFAALLFLAAPAFAVEQQEEAVNAEADAPFPVVVTLELEEPDIENWEINDTGNILQLHLTEEKAAEIRAFTTENVGHRMDIYYSSASIHTGKIKKPMEIERTFVMVLPPEQSELLVERLDPTKELKDEEEGVSATMGIGAETGDADAAPEAKEESAE